MNKLINDLGLNEKINQCIPIKEEQDEFKCETNKTDDKTIYKCNRDKYKNKIKEKYYDKLCKYESLLKAKMIRMDKMGTARHKVL